MFPFCLLAFWYSCREAQLFVGSIHVSDDNSHHISQGLLTSWVESGFLLHNLDNDFRNNLRTHTKQHPTSVKEQQQQQKQKTFHSQVGRKWNQNQNILLISRGKYIRNSSPFKEERK